MSTVEEKEIGIPIGVDKGKYVGTIFTAGHLQLAEMGENEDGETIYEKEGYWESNVIDTVDKFREYDKIAVTKIQYDEDVYKIETRTSDNGITFNEYVSLSASSHILSPMKRYIQVKITLYAGLLGGRFTISDFDEASDVNEWESSDYIETDGVLRLKRDYDLKMSEDTSWNDEGYLFRKLFKEGDWRRIDAIRIE